MDSITRNQPENQVQPVQAHGLPPGESPPSHSHMSGHLPWAEARLLQGPFESLPVTEQPRLSTAHAQSHRPKPVQFLRVKFNHFHNWSLEVCRVPAYLFQTHTACLRHLWFPRHSS